MSYYPVVPISLCENYLPGFTVANGHRAHLVFWGGSLRMMLLNPRPWVRAFMAIIPL